jgi:hypothetical protein
VGVWHGADDSETITGVRMWRSESNGSKFSVAMRLSASRTVATATTSEFVTYPNGTVVRFVPASVTWPSRLRPCPYNAARSLKRALPVPT